MGYLSTSSQGTNDNRPDFDDDDDDEDDEGGLGSRFGPGLGSGLGFGSHSGDRDRERDGQQPLDDDCDSFDSGNGHDPDYASDPTDSFGFPLGAR